MGIVGIVGIVGVEEEQNRIENENETNNIEEVIDFYYTMKGLLLQNQMDFSSPEYRIPIKTLYPISQPIPIPIPKKQNDGFCSSISYVKPIASSYRCDVYNLPQIPRRNRE